MKDFLSVFFICISGWSLTGQITMSGGFVQDTVVIGDSAQFILSLEIDKDVEVIGIPTFFIDSIYSALQSIKAHADTSQPVIPVLADFELVSTGGFKDDNKDGFFTAEEMNWNRSSIGNKLLLQNTFTIRPWDPGENIVIYPPVIYVKNGTQDHYLREEQMRVFVAPPAGLPAVQDSLNIAPIKNILEEKANISDYIIIFILVGLAILIGLFYWLYVKYFKNSMDQKVVESEPEIYIPPHELALEKLAELKSQNLWQQGDIKKYQSELTYIIREYLEGRYEIPALESTTDEVIRKLVKELLKNDNVISVKRILQVADLVKFAKAKPEENIHESFMNEAIDFVERTKNTIGEEEDLND